MESDGTFWWGQNGAKSPTCGGMETRVLPGARVVAQLVHVWVVLGHDGDCIALLANDESSLLFRSISQVDAVELKKER